MAQMVEKVKQALRPVEEQWGVKVHEFGFSTFSPTPETLEITQLEKLANEKLKLYRQFHEEQGLSTEAAVSLISGAVMALSSHGVQVPEPAPQVPEVGLTVEQVDGGGGTCRQDQVRSMRAQDLSSCLPSLCASTLMRMETDRGGTSHVQPYNFTRLTPRV